MSKKLNWEHQEIPHRNKSSHGSYRDAYTEEMIQIVYNVYKRDINDLNYDF